MISLKWESFCKMRLKKSISHLGCAKYDNIDKDCWLVAALAVYKTIKNVKKVDPEVAKTLPWGYHKLSLSLTWAPRVFAEQK